MMPHADAKFVPTGAPVRYEPDAIYEEGEYSYDMEKRMAENNLDFYVLE